MDHPETPPGASAPHDTQLQGALRAAVLDRTSPMPYYHQVKHALVSAVATLGLRAGDRVPGDHQLCEFFGVSRSVVRQALSELEAEGLVERVKGRGTFVAAPKVPEGLVRSTAGLHEEAAARGSRVVSDVLRQEIEAADESQAAALGVAPGTRILVIERVRRVDGEPWAHTTSFMPADRVPGLEGEDLREQSLYTLLRERYGLVPAGGRRSLEAAPAPVRAAHLLGTTEGAPVLVLRSVLRDAAGDPYEAFIAYHRGDRSRFEVELADDAEVARLAPIGDVRT